MPPFPVERPVLLDPVVPFNRRSISRTSTDKQESGGRSWFRPDARKSALVDAVLEAA